MLNNRWLPLAAVVSVMALVGCGPDGPVTYPVAGKVTLAGEPVAEGEIVFRDAGGAEGSRGAKIKDGSYTFESTAGAKHVEITAHRKIEVPPSPSGEGGTNYEMYIPKKYNVKTELTAEVTAAGPNTHARAIAPASRSQGHDSGHLPRRPPRVVVSPYAATSPTTLLHIVDVLSRYFSWRAGHAMSRDVPVGTLLAG